MFRVKNKQQQQPWLHAHRHMDYLVMTGQPAGSPRLNLSLPKALNRARRRPRAQWAPLPVMCKTSPTAARQLRSNCSMETARGEGEGKASAEQSSALPEEDRSSSSQ